MNRFLRVKLGGWRKKRKKTRAPFCTQVASCFHDKYIHAVARLFTYSKFFITVLDDRPDDQSAQLWQVCERLYKRGR